MIRIEHLSLDLTAPDEEFARRLYTDWDAFCRDCVEQVLDKCLSPYDRDRTLHEIESLDLDLGNIAEEDFYREFPKRLREELLKSIPQWNSRDAKADGRNLLHYLEYGHPLAEWADTDCNMEADLEWLSGQPDLISLPIIKQLAQLCLRREHALRRLSWQTTDEHILLQVFSLALTEPSAGNKEKRRLLALLLEVNPDVPVRFVRETDDDGRLQDLSVLLDTLSVRQLIQIETKEHAEVDLPPYWHYLYEWLIRYYPYNGIAVFGGKEEFIRHLHHRLLTFIHKRNGTSYLSKTELTVSFLLEVFGHTYYKDVLNAIFLLQPHNPDGSPVYDSYFSLELYRTFVRLSLLRLPEEGQEGFVANKKQKKEGTREIQWLTEPETITALLKDTQTDDREKYTLLLSFVQSHPETLVLWLQSEGLKSPELLSTLAKLANKFIVDHLLASLSFAVWEQVAKTESHIKTYKSEIFWLKDVPDGTLHTALQKSILVWISQKHYNLPEEESIRRLLLAFYYELNGTVDKGTTDNGTGYGHEKDMEKLSAAILSESRQPLHVHVDIEELARILKDPVRGDAYKRMLWTMLVREQPEEIIRWIQATYAKDDTLLSLLAELSDDATVNRLLATYSLTAWEALDYIRNYLERHKDGITRLKGIAESQWASALRRVALLLPASGGREQTDDIKDLLRLIYREVTGGGNHEESTVDALARELEEAGCQTVSHVSHEKEKIRDEHHEDLRELRRMMCAPNLSETVKRRITARYWDISKENPIEAVSLLQEQGMLEEVLEQTGRYAWETILYRILRRTAGLEKAAALMPLFLWLAAHETVLSSYWADNNHSLRAELLLVAVGIGEGGQDKPLKSEVHLLLASLFREDSLPIIWKQLVQDTTAGALDAEHAFTLSYAALDGESSDLPSLYQEWLHEHEDTSNALQTLFEHQWSTAAGFAEWVSDTSVPISIKREMLREAVYEKPQEWLRLLRVLPHESRSLAFLDTLMSAQDLLHAMATADFYQATVLSRIVERLRGRSTGLPGSLTRYTSSLDIFLRRALLAYLQNKETSGRILSEKEVAGVFLSYLRLAATGKVADETEWRRLAETITDSQDKADGLSQAALLQILMTPSVTHTALRQALDHLMDKYPEELRTWLEGEAGKDDIARMAEIMDNIQISHWVDSLTQAPGFVHPDALRRLASWLQQRMSSGQLATALFLYVREPGWKAFTPEQMEAYFFSQFSMAADGLLPPEALTDDSMPEDTRKRLLRSYLRLRPEKLLAFIRESVLRNIRSLEKWLEWMDGMEWMYMAASLSLAKAELLRQVMDSLSLTKEERKEGLATYILYSDTEEWSYDTPQETVRDFIGMLPFLQETDSGKKAEALHRVETELDLPEAETPVEKEQAEVVMAGNAGLCLLAPWFVRLFAMLGYLDEERKMFRNTASKVRAVFLLQYIAYGEERKWREAELTFNRLLTALPGNVPLPRSVHLTDEERQTADSMVAGVKANWLQMSGTSVEGFRRSFLIREGRLEKEDERWLLTVEDKAYDVLLETIPWGFRQIRLPWLKKYVQVRWHEKQVF